MAAELTFYFDFVSPYAYLAWADANRGPRALAARHGVTLALRPILFAGLLERWGQLGPAEIPPKRAFLIKDVLRHAARAGIPLVYPAVHPFNPLPLLRLALLEVAGDAERQATAIDALFALAWAGVGDAADPAAALSARGLDGSRMVERTRDAEVKATLKRETDDAMAAGVFGVPTYVARGELFWGNDRADDVDRHLAGEDPLDGTLAAEIIARPMGIARRKQP